MVGYAAPIAGTYTYNYAGLYPNREADTDIFRVTDDLMTIFQTLILVQNPAMLVEKVGSYDANSQSINLGLGFEVAQIPTGVTLDFMFMLGGGNAANYYNQDEAVNVTAVAGDPYVAFDSLGAMYTRVDYTWTFYNLINYTNLQVSASFNPYSQHNIIGSLHEEYHSGPILFPYDRNPEVNIKIRDQYGIPIKSKLASGYVDLDLIVDNSSSYSIDD
jgi:hypothetical protein